ALQQDCFAVLRDAGAIVEQTFGDAAFHEELMIAVGETVRFVADALKEFQRTAVLGKSQRLGPTWPIHFLEFLGEADDWNIVETESLQFAAGRAELAFATIDDD